MKKINPSIPTIITNKKLKTKRKKEIEAPPSVVIFQHNNLVEARYSLTLQEKRIILWLASRITPNDKDFDTHILSVQEFMSLLDISGKANYKELQKITLGLMKKALVIKHPEEQIVTQVSWLNYAQYREREGRIYLSFSEKMRPFLLELKERFTAISMTDLMQFTSIHAIRIYELLKQYQDIGERTLSVEEIKECCGVKNKLKRYSDFEKKILLISQREINEKSDIQFDFERIKHSRKIVAIRFLVSKNKKYNRGIDEIKEIEDPRRKPPLYDTLREFGLTARVTNNILKESEHEDIQNAVKSVDIQISRGNVRNAKAMLLTAIKEKWHPDRYKSQSA